MTSELLKQVAQTQTIEETEDSNGNSFYEGIQAALVGKDEEPELNLATFGEVTDVFLETKSFV